MPAYNSLQLNDMAMSPDSVPALANPVAGYSQPLSLGSNYGRMQYSTDTGNGAGEGYLQVGDNQGPAQPVMDSFDEPSALQMKLMKRKASQNHVAEASAGVAGFTNNGFGTVTARRPVVQNPIPTWDEGDNAGGTIAETSFGGPPNPPPRPSMAEDANYATDAWRVQPGKWDRRPVGPAPAVVSSRQHGVQLTDHLDAPGGATPGGVSLESLHARAMAGLANMTATPQTAAASRWKAAAAATKNVSSLLPVYRRQHQQMPAAAVSVEGIQCSHLGNCKCPDCV